MKNRSGRGKIVIFMILALVIFLVAFYFLANRERPEGLETLSPTESVIQKDLSINYPQTPKAVVRYYAELSQCMYDPTNSDQEVEEIARQSRLLFDEELKAVQTDYEYLSSLKGTIASFIRDSRKIVSFTISPSSEVVYDTTEIGEMASLYCTYTMQKGSVSYTDAEHFLLRKDGEGRWKILGWQSASLDNNITGSTGGAGGNASGSDTSDEGEAGKQGGEDTVEIPEVKIETPTVEIPTVEINVP